MVKRNTLLLLAAIIWGIAGFNVLKIGIETYLPFISVINILLSIVVFGIFFKFIFGKLVKKHTARIISYPQDEKQLFYKFFDLKSFIIMVVMIVGGILIRSFSLLPDVFIAVFYTGLGAALFSAGVWFEINYIKAIKEKETK